MRKNILFFILCIPLPLLFSQTSFVINTIKGPDISYLCDVQFHDHIYYGLTQNTEPVSPYRVSCTLYLFDESGQKLNEYPLGNFGYQYFQIIDIAADTLTLAGSIDNDSCSATLVISKYIIGSGAFTHISQFDFCKNDDIVKRMNLVKGLGNELFIEGDYGNRISSGLDPRSFIMALDQDYQWHPLLDSNDVIGHLSIDFSEKGYVDKALDLCNFYDRNFNRRKQRYNDFPEFKFDQYSFNVAFGHKYILDQVNKNEGDPRGEAIRLIDSNFHVIKLVVPAPTPFNYKPMALPRFGGIEVVNDHTIWTTANYGDAYYTDYGYFAITKLDGDLNLLCQQFIGYDKFYRIVGISAIENEGAIVFGYQLPVHHSEFSGDVDIYAYKISDNCELATAIADPSHSFYTISAFPNPTINSITFNIIGFDPPTLSVQIINASGVPVFEHQDLSFEIDVKDLPAGQYFYRILQKEKVLGVGPWVKL